MEDEDTNKKGRYFQIINTMEKTTESNGENHAQNKTKLRKYYKPTSFRGRCSL